MANVPILHSDQGLTQYLQEIRKFPILSADEEYMLAKRWKEYGDREAAHKLVTSHLRLVAKIAMGYRGYGLPVSDLISEGSVGMMQAVKKFDPERGFRLATYAMWWIRASMQEYILRSWSLVKIGTTAAQKKLFFNLRRIKNQMHEIDNGNLSPEQVEQIADQLDVTEQDVLQMNERMSGRDQSLNAPISKNGEPGEWIDWLEDKSQNPETQFFHDDEMDKRRTLMQNALENLSDREQNILTQRRLSDNPKTLEDLSQKYGISRERVRQIEQRAFEKLQSQVLEKTGTE